MAASKLRESDLYAPVKALLEGQGYEVKGEIGVADIVAVRDDEEPVIVELKTTLSLTLFHQAIARQSMTDAVYIAVARKPGRAFAKAIRLNRTLCRRLGLGLMTVRLNDGSVEVHADPAPYAPRKSKTRKARLLGQFDKLVGDPNTGGTTRRRLMTAYRQDALRCVHVLTRDGPTKAAEVARRTGVEKARRLMADNHYGWFERVGMGVYDLSPKGHRAAEEYGNEIANLAQGT